MTRKRFYIGLGIFLFIFVALVIVVSVNNGALDYALSKTLVTTLEPGTRYATTMFGRLGEMLGESPLYLLIQFSFIVFAIVTSKRKNKPLFIVLEIVFLLVSACAGLACVHRIEKYICLYYSPESEWKELFAILPLIVNFVIGSGITLLVFFLLKKPLSKVNEKNLLSYFIMGLIACGVALILFNYFFKTNFNSV
jgi:hypothetical protein